jgi:hypothetical protein
MPTMTCRCSSTRARANSRAGPTAAISSATPIPARNRRVHPLLKVLNVTANTFPAWSQRTAVCLTSSALDSTGAVMREPACTTACGGGDGFLGYHGPDGLTERRRRAEAEALSA